MIEVEVKVRVGDPGGFMKNLEKAGAEFLKEESQRDVYLKHPCRDFHQSDEALRIREAEGRFLLTYKGPKVGGVGKSREEVETEVGEGIAEVLRKVGFEVADVVEKVRRVYRLGKVTVCLDRVEGLGWFAEAEVRAGEPSQEEELLRLLRSMGGGESVRLSYLELLMGTL